MKKMLDIYSYKSQILDLFYFFDRKTGFHLPLAVKGLERYPEGFYYQLVFSSHHSARLCGMNGTNIEELFYRRADGR